MCGSGCSPAEGKCLLGGYAGLTVGKPSTTSGCHMCHRALSAPPEGRGSAARGCGGQVGDTGQCLRCLAGAGGDVCNWAALARPTQGLLKALLRKSSYPGNPIT